VASFYISMWDRSRSELRTKDACFSPWTAGRIDYKYRTLFGVISNKTGG
jgi:hypothetical protein